MAFLANINATWQSQDGFGRYGQVSLQDPVTVKIAIVNLELTRQRTSVRTDSSGSRGHADEQIGTRVRLLFPPSSEPKNGDKVTVGGRELKVISTFPRYDVRGKLDHHQIDCDAWSDQ